MKVVFSFQKNNSSTPQNSQMNFGAGLTPKMMQEIQQSDVLDISNNLAKKGILTDFKGNKVIAWCCDKTIQIFEQLNQEYKLKLSLPKGIYVEDFEKLNIEEATAYGLCNLFPTNLRKNTNIKTPGQTLFFNTFETALTHATPGCKWFFNWNNVNEISNANFAARYSATDHFLGEFLHEFTHNAHESRLFDKLGGEKLFEKFQTNLSEKQIEEYRKKYGDKIAKNYDYALTNPFDAVACDMSRVIANSLDKETLMPTKNPFSGTSYENLSFWQRVNLPTHKIDEDVPLEEILRNFWNGKFD